MRRWLSQSPSQAPNSVDSIPFVYLYIVLIMESKRRWSHLAFHRRVESLFLQSLIETPSLLTENFFEVLQKSPKKEHKLTEKDVTLLLKRIILAGDVRMNLIDTIEVSRSNGLGENYKIKVLSRWAHLAQSKKWPRGWTNRTRREIENRVDHLRWWDKRISPAFIINEKEINYS